MKPKGAPTANSTSEADPPGLENLSTRAEQNILPLLGKAFLV
jgi:hypothetical protein